MTEKYAPSMEAAPLYEGRSVPFEQLSADDFEKCVFACFQCIQSYQGLRVDGQPSGSGDGGFDVDGVAVDSNRVLCVQCKRQKESLGLPLLARELAKVAATSHLEHSDVGVHIFICTGGLTQELRRLLRETDRTRISKAAREAFLEAKGGELKNLRERMIEAGRDPELVVGSYVRGLDRLVAWDMKEFDVALSPAWDSALTVLSRFFKISTVVREHPRALFEREAYQHRCASLTAVVQPRLEPGGLPAGLVEVSGADPGPQKVPPRKDLPNVKSLAALAPGEAALVVAEGGAGKTTLLGLVRAEVADQCSDSALAVLVTCAEYVAGGLDNAVHAQLGVRSGTWRMLPDHIQILCDGINEAPPDAARALFGELKPLLNSKRVSCVFTSREDSRVVRTVLPTVPCATLRLVPLSPGRVRAMARHALKEESAVTAFAEAHRRMAARGTGPFMWTPFAVRVALKHWEESQQLGNTLGDLLDAIVTARAERDLEISTQDSSANLPRSTVLRLASAIAFEMLVVDGEATCSADVIGATLERAKRLCAGTFGVECLNSIELIGVLQKHDLVQRTADENFRWNHQLVAGALAAQHLARNWRRHICALQQPLADDAWVFATRYIPDAELDDYLATLFNADLLLGARATAELSFDQRDRSLQHIAKALQPEQPEELQATGLFAVARVGTERALSILRGLAEHRRSELGFIAARALAYSGDREFLLGLAAKVDRCRQGGWGMSGGEIAIWETASLADRVAIARERMTAISPGEPVNESLRLVTCEASLEDLPSLEGHFQAAKDLTAWNTALAAIQRADGDRAQNLLDAVLLETGDSVTRATLTTAGHRLGLVVDVENAFALLMDLATAKPGDAGGILARDDLAKYVLGQLPLTEKVRSTIEEELPRSGGRKKEMLWQLATRLNSASLAAFALDTFQNDPEQVGAAANFFLDQPQLREKHRDALQRSCGQYLEDKANWFTFGSWRVFALLAELGFTLRTVHLLERMILRLAEVLEIAESGRKPDFDESEAEIAKGFTVDSASIHLRHHAGLLVTGAVGASDLLQPSVLLKFLHFELARSTPGKEMVDVYRKLDAAALDDELCSVRDPWAQRGALVMLCEFGLTERRLELLRTHLKETYCHPAGLHMVKEALEKCWNTDACNMVVETVASFEEWEEDWQQFFWDFSHMVSERLTAAERSLVEHHVLLAKTPFARRILRIWRQATLDSRVGLSRLEEGPQEEN